MSFTANIDDVVAENRNRLLGKRPEWKRVRLKEVATILNGYPFESARFRRDGGTPLLRIRDIVPGKTETFYEGDFDPAFLVEHGEIIVGMDGDFHCQPWTGEKALLNQRVCKIVPDESRYTKQFLRYVLPGYLSAINEQTPSVTVKHLSSRTIADIPLPLPSLDEQRRIVAEIEKQFTRLEAGVTALRRVQANLKRYRAAVLKAACEGRLVPTKAELAKAENRKFETGQELLARILTERRQNWQGRGKYKEPDAPEAANLGPLPEGWTWTNLDAAIVSGPQNGVYLPRALYGRGYVILRIDDYQDGWVRGVDELKKVSADQVMAAKYQLLSGDLVINRVNSLTHLGKCLVVHETHAGALFESNMMKAHLAAGVNPRYVEFYLRSRDGRTKLISGAKWAVNQASINQEDVKRTPLPLPPLAEQTRIVAEVERRLSVVEELEAAVTANLQRGTGLRQSILRHAFNDKLHTN